MAKTIPLEIRQQAWSVAATTRDQVATQQGATKPKPVGPQQLGALRNNAPTPEQVRAAQAARGVQPSTAAKGPGTKGPGAALAAGGVMSTGKSVDQRTLGHTQQQSAQRVVSGMKKPDPPPPSSPSAAVKYGGRTAEQAGAPQAQPPKAIAPSKVAPPPAPDTADSPQPSTSAKAPAPALQAASPGKSQAVPSPGG